MSFQWIDPAARKTFTGLTLPDRDLVDREGVSKVAAVIGPNNDVLATASLWLDAPRGPDGRSSAYVGHFASNAKAASATLLSTLAHEAARAGRERILAPIDGSTWRSYRVVVESNGRQPFFLEPQSPPDWESHFLAGGFHRGELYGSLELEDLAPFAGQDDHAKELAAAGITIRDFNMQNFDADLVQMHKLSLDAFAANPYYSPLSFAEFAAMYRPAVFLYEQGLALVAEKDGEAIGLIFAYRDGAKKETTVMKTIAVSPKIRQAGLASHLTRRVLARAHELGCASAIMALMHEKNKSFSWATRHATVFRRYALMAKDL
jgi:GNAT superfamily N-acetyltransferase